MKVAGPVRVAHIVTHPIQYFAPLYRALARRTEIDLTVYFCSDQGLRTYHDPDFGHQFSWDVPLLDGYRSVFLTKGMGRVVSGRFFHTLDPEVFCVILLSAYDVLWIHGYGNAASWLAAAAARIRRRPVLLREEATLLDNRPLRRRFLKEVPLRWLCRNASGLYIGTNNRSYLRRYGIPPSRLFSTPYCVDNEAFARQSEQLRPRRSELRRQFDLPETAPVILFCGKLIPKKDPLGLLKAFALVREEFAAALLFAGDGPQRSVIEDVVRSEAIPDVNIAGFLNQSEIAQAYAVADVLVLPSIYQETWGLVVNEAMNFGLPIVVSDRVGCAVDLVRPDVNGYVVPAGNVTALTEAIRKLVADAELRRAFGTASQEIVRDYSIEKAADGIVRACLGVTSPCKKCR